MGNGREKENTNIEKSMFKDILLRLLWTSSVIFRGCIRGGISS